MIFMGISMIMGLVFPLIGLILMRRRYNSSIKPFIIGCAVMFVFVFLLESTVHRIVLSNSEMAEWLGKRPLFFALYGGLMAGVFEEIGRFIAFKTFLRKMHDRNENALMYGIGHGGFESIMLLTIGMLSNLAVSFTINSTGGETLPAALWETANLLISSPSWIFLVGIVERAFAIVIQISLSVIVWFAAKNLKKLWLLPLAIILHTISDMIPTYMSSKGSHILLTELMVMIIAIITAIIAYGLWKENGGAFGDE